MLRLRGIIDMDEKLKDLVSEYMGKDITEEEKEFASNIDLKSAVDSVLICGFYSGYKAAINTPEYKTVEELRKAYEFLVICGCSWQIDTEEFMCEDCLEIGKNRGDIEHHESCIIFKAKQWISNHGKQRKG